MKRKIPASIIGPACHEFRTSKLSATVVAKKHNIARSTLFKYLQNYDTEQYGGFEKKPHTDDIGQCGGGVSQKPCTELAIIEQPKYKPTKNSYQKYQFLDISHMESDLENNF